MIRTTVLLLLAIAASAVAETKRPNIVFIFSDDHACQAISAYGEARKLIDTPHIDRIAREGLRFDRCLVTNSICGPSRATVLTGTYNHINGYVNNSNMRFDGSQTTFPKLLQKSGYQTAMIGKWHLESDPMGFDFWQVLPGLGVYYNPPMIKMGERVQLEGYVTDIITDLSLDWLQQRDKSKPFLLMCQHRAPHREWEPALRHLGHNQDRQYPEPATLFDTYRGRGVAEATQDMTIRETMTPKDLKLVAPPQLTPEQRKTWDAYYEPRNAAYREKNPQGDDLVRWRYQRYLHDYLGCIRSVDEGVGKVLKYLDDEGLAENTIVIYSADQGFFLGEHGWFDKRWFFEESLRTPLLVRWPGVTKPGGVSKKIVSNLDFAQTFLEAAGLPQPAPMQGRSLVPLLRGQTPADWRTSFYYHYYEFTGTHHVRPHYAVITERHKLVHFYGTDVDYWELFDTEKDPQEMTDVLGQTDYAATEKQLRAELQRLRTELKVTDEHPRSWFGRGDGKPAPKKAPPAP